MSGPIVRKYGFPNFEKIFGERPLEHGVEETKGSEAEAKSEASAKQQNSGTASERTTPDRPTRDQ